MYRCSATCFLLSAFPILAEKAAVDPYEDLPDYFPQHYRSLADVPKQYHDGEKLTGCFIHDSLPEGWLRIPNASDDDDIECHNPFYWDEHGRIKTVSCEYGEAPLDSVSLVGASRAYAPAPCKNCLDGEQAIDIVRVYHQGLNIEPLGYHAMIVHGYPWNGLGAPFCEKYPREHITWESLRDPHPNERVNMRRIRRPMMGFNELCDAARDPRNRDLTWKVSFQIGWNEPENQDFEKHTQHHPSSIGQRTACISSHYIHAQTGLIIAHFDAVTKGTGMWDETFEDPYDETFWVARVVSRDYYFFQGAYGFAPKTFYSPECYGPTVLDKFVDDRKQAIQLWSDTYQRVYRHLPDSPVRYVEPNPYLDLKGAIPAVIEDLKRLRELFKHR